MSGSGSSRDDGFPNQPTMAGDPPRPPAPADGPRAGDGGPPGGGGTGGPTDTCAVVQRAPLNSADPAIVAGLRTGSELDVFLDESGPRPVLGVRDRRGQVAGSLTHRGHVLLLQCMGRGWTYKAVVLSVSGGLVELRIEPA